MSAAQLFHQNSEEPTKHWRSVQREGLESKQLVYLASRLARASGEIMWKRPASDFSNSSAHVQRCGACGVLGSPQHRNMSSVKTVWIKYKRNKMPHLKWNNRRRKRLKSNEGHGTNATRTKKKFKKLRSSNTMQPRWAVLSVCRDWSETCSAHNAAGWLRSQFWNLARPSSHPRSKAFSVLAHCQLPLTLMKTTTASCPQKVTEKKKKE